jgi:hypothetical protein
MSGSAFSIRRINGAEWLMPGSLDADPSTVPTAGKPDTFEGDDDFKKALAPSM